MRPITIACLFVILFASGALYAQNFKVSGVVVDQKYSESLPGATVSLYNSDSSYARKSITDLSGNFSFQVSEGNYSISIDFIGFKRYNSQFAVTSTLDLGKILLTEDIKKLNEVVVEGKIPPAVAKGDTIQFNAKGYKTNKNADASDLITKMPGMQEQNGKLKAQGEEVQQVLVDGKPFFGKDPNATLKNLPAEMIDKVEVYNQESEQSRFTGIDDGERTKTINIVTKEEYRNGKFGNVYAGYGTDDRYRAGGVLNSFNGDQRITILGQVNNINQQNFSSQDLSGLSSGDQGSRRRHRNTSGADADDFLVDQQDGITETQAFGINYADQIGEKLEFNLSYLLNNSNNTSTISDFRDYYSISDSGQVYSENEFIQTKDLNHRLNLRMDYNPNENNQFIFRPNASFQTNEGESVLLGSTADENGPINSIDRSFNSDLKAWNFENDIIWNHKFKKEGRTLSTRIENQFNGTDANNDLLSLNEYFRSGQLDSVDQNSNLNRFEQEHELRIRYTEPISEKVSLQLSYRPEYSFNNSDKKTYSYNGVDYERDSSLSNEVSSSYHTQAIEPGIQYNHKGFRVSLRVRAQYALLQADQVYPYQLDTYNQYFNILPSLSIRYKFDQKKQVRLYYRNRTSPPAISQLQEVVDNSNPLQLKIGNSNLNQELEHRLFLHYSSSNTETGIFFFQMLRASVTQDYVANSSFIANNDTVVYGVNLQPGTQLTRPVNLDGYWNIGTHSSFGKSVEPLKSNVNISLDLDYARIPSLINEQTNFVNNPSIGVGLGLSSNISEKLDFSIQTTSTQNFSLNTLNTNMDTRYFNQSTKVRVYWNFWKTIFYRTELNHQYYDGLSSSFDNNYILWNMSIGTNLLKDDRGELSVSVFDVLNQNNSVSRTTTETYIQDTQTQVLQRYFMLNFRYNIQSFKAKEKAELN